MVTVAFPDEQVVAQPVRKLRAEDMYNTPRDGNKYELIDGEEVMLPAGMQHEGIAADLITWLGLYLKTHGLGRAFTSSVGFQLRNGDVVSPDVSFVSLTRLPSGRGSEKKKLGRPIGRPSLMLCP